MKFAVPQPDGTVTIIAAAPREHLEPLIGTPDENGVRHLSEADWRAHVLERNGLTEKDVTDLPDDWAPPDGDRAFRNAWVLTGKDVTVDMPKARELHRDRLRVLRAPKLAELDMQYLRADETKDETEKARIATEKQALRDVTADPAIEAATTPEELKAVIPNARQFFSGGDRKP